MLSCIIMSTNFEIDLNCKFPKESKINLINFYSKDFLILNIKKKITCYPIIFVLFFDPVSGKNILFVFLFILI